MEIKFIFILWFANILIKFYLKKGIEFTITSAVVTLAQQQIILKLFFYTLAILNAISWNKTIFSMEISFTFSSLATKFHYKFLKTMNYQPLLITDPIIGSTIKQVNDNSATLQITLSCIASHPVEHIQLQTSYSVQISDTS